MPLPPDILSDLQEASRSRVFRDREEAVRYLFSTHPSLADLRRVYGSYEEFIRRNPTLAVAPSPELNRVVSVLEEEVKRGRISIGGPVGGTFRPPSVSRTVSEAAEIARSPLPAVVRYPLAAFSAAAGVLSIPGDWIENVLTGGRGYRSWLVSRGVPDDGSPSSPAAVLSFVARSLLDIPTVVPAVLRRVRNVLGLLAAGKTEEALKAVSEISGTGIPNIVERVTPRGGPQLRVSRRVVVSGRPPVERVVLRPPEPRRVFREVSKALEANQEILRSQNPLSHLLRTHPIERRAVRGGFVGEISRRVQELSAEVVRAIRGQTGGIRIEPPVDVRHVRDAIITGKLDRRDLPRAIRLLSGHQARLLQDSVTRTLEIPPEIFSTVREVLPWIQTRADYVALRSILRDFVSAAYEYRTFYKKAAEIARTILDREEALEFIAYLAATSPRASLDRNLEMALNAFMRGKVNKRIRGLADEILKYLQNPAEAPLNARKVVSFALGIAHEYDPQTFKPGLVAVDTWMYKAFGIEEETLKRLSDKKQKALYDFIEATVQDIADELKMPPHEVQAAIWAAVRGREDEAFYTHVFGKYIVQGSIESIWSGSPLENAPWSVKKAFTEGVMRILYPNGRDIVAEAINRVLPEGRKIIPPRRPVLALGYWEEGGRVFRNPAVQLEVPAPSVPVRYWMKVDDPAKYPGAVQVVYRYVFKNPVQGATKVLLPEPIRKTVKVATREGEEYTLREVIPKHVTRWVLKSDRPLPVKEKPEVWIAFEAKGTKLDLAKSLGVPDTKLLTEYGISPGDDVQFYAYLEALRRVTNQQAVGVFRAARTPFVEDMDAVAVRIVGAEDRFPLEMSLKTQEWLSKQLQGKGVVVPTHFGAFVQKIDPDMPIGDFQILVDRTFRKALRGERIQVVPFKNIGIGGSSLLEERAAWKLEVPQEVVQTIKSRFPQVVERPDGVYYVGDELEALKSFVEEVTGGAGRVGERVRGVGYPEGVARILEGIGDTVDRLRATIKAYHDTVAERIGRVEERIRPVAGGALTPEEQVDLLTGAVEVIADAPSLLAGLSRAREQFGDWILKYRPRLVRAALELNWNRKVSVLNGEDPIPPREIVRAIIGVPSGERVLISPETQERLNNFLIDLLGRVGLERNPERSVIDQLLEAVRRSKEFGVDLLDVARTHGYRTIDELTKDLSGYRLSAGEAGRILQKIRRLERVFKDDAVVSAAADAARESLAVNDWWYRLLGINRALAITQFATAARNFLTQIAVVPVRAMDIAFEAALRSVFSRNTGRSLSLFADPALEFEALFRTLTSPRASIRLVEEITTAHPGARALAEGVLFAELHHGSTSKVVERLLTFQKFAERWTAASALRAELIRELRRIGVNSLEDVVRIGGWEAIPREIVEKASAAALEAVFAKTTEVSRLVNRMIYGPTIYHKIAALGQAMIVPYFRFVTNATSFVITHSPVGFLEAVRLALSRETDDAIVAAAKALTGISLVLVGYQFRERNPNLPWYQIQVGDKVVDMRPYSPFSGYLYLGEVMRRLKTKDEWPNFRVTLADVAEAVLGVNLRAGVGLALSDFLKQGGDIPGLVQQSIADTVARFTVPFNMIKDVVAEFDDAHRIRRSTFFIPSMHDLVKDTAMEPLERILASMIRNIPGLYTLLPEAPDVFTGEYARASEPLLRQLTGILVARELDHPVVQEMYRLGWTEQQIFQRRRYRDDVAEFLYRWEVAYVLPGMVMRAMNSPAYWRLPDVKKQALIYRIITRAKDIAANRARREYPEIFREVMEEERRRRMPAVLREGE